MAVTKNQVIENKEIIKINGGLTQEKNHTSKMQGLPGMSLKRNDVENSI